MVVNDNDHFAQFQPKDVENYDFLVYSPKSIVKSDVKSFLSQDDVDIKNRPMIIDKESFRKPDFMDRFEIPTENRDVRVDLKLSEENKTKYYLKISNVDSSKPFLLQLNQTFGVSWKLHWVDKDFFEEKPCSNNPINYSITNNSVCNYKSGLLELGDARFISKPKVGDDHHFEGNFVGNTWVVTPDDFPEQMKSQDELYAVIVYEKQTYYSYALLISIATFLITLGVVFYQEVSLFLQKYKTNAKR
jgi:hypothetical protein